MFSIQRTIVKSLRHLMIAKKYFLWILFLNIYEKRKFYIQLPKKKMSTNDKRKKDREIKSALSCGLSQISRIPFTHLCNSGCEIRRMHFI